MFSMVFGESILNDAVAIVLSRTLLSFNEPDAVYALQAVPGDPLLVPSHAFSRLLTPSQTVDIVSVSAAILSFLIIFVGSAVVGIFWGSLASCARPWPTQCQQVSCAHSASRSPVHTVPAGLLCTQRQQVF